MSRVQIIYQKGNGYVSGMVIVETHPQLDNEAEDVLRISLALGDRVVWNTLESGDVSKLYQALGGWLARAR